MLRAQYICNTYDQVKRTIAKLENNSQDNRVKILRIKPRFGPPKNLNDVTVNFAY